MLTHWYSDLILSYWSNHTCASMVWPLRCFQGVRGLLPSSHVNSHSLSHISYVYHISQSNHQFCLCSFSSNYSYRWLLRRTSLPIWVWSMWSPGRETHKHVSLTDTHTMPPWLHTVHHSHLSTRSATHSCNLISKSLIWVDFYTCVLLLD